MQEIVSKYFIDPIWQRSGYNAINTLAYAAIALISIYFIWRFLKKRGFDFSSREFLLGAGAFVLLGSTSRVLTDLSDAGAISVAASSGGLLGAVYSLVDQSGVFEYGYLTVTPGIYLVVAALFLLSIVAARWMRMPMFPFYAGTALWIHCLVLLIPFMSHFSFFGIALTVAGAGSLAAYAVVGRTGATSIHEKLAILGQALDGAATFVVIDIFAKETGKSYFEQHVLSAGIGSLTPLGFGLFFLVKLALASLIVYFLRKERAAPSDKALMLTVVAIMGFAPGIRDALRMLVGS